MSFELPPLALYIHIPWCVRKCPYCDFNSHTVSHIPEKQYVETLLTDLKQSLIQIENLSNRVISSIFIGGGTPSLFSHQSIQMLIEKIRLIIEIKPGAEITIEANPGTTDQRNFEGYQIAGINRLSLGIQSLNDMRLKDIGRIHTSEQAISAIHAARLAGLTNINLDLMFGLPNQTAPEMLEELHQILELKPEHLSYYQLTLEPGTQFYRSPPALPDSDELWNTQQTAQQVLQQNNYENYEVSAWAKPNKQCQHNLNYWHFGDYIGIGAGAHGKITTKSGVILRTEKPASPSDYASQVHSASSHCTVHQVSTEELPMEFMMNVLRLKKGVPSQLFEDRTGLSRSVLDTGLTQAKRLGLMHKNPSLLQCTVHGWQFLNDTASLFIPEP